MSESKYPNCELLDQHNEHIKFLLEFMEWAAYTHSFRAVTAHQGVHDKYTMPVYEEKLLAFVHEFIGVDPKALEQERREILKAARDFKKDNK